jgi:aminopeptidase
VLKISACISIVLSVAFVSASALASCADQLQANEPWGASRNKKLIDLVIRNGIDFRPGDKVYVSGTRYVATFVDAVAEELLKRGAASVKTSYSVAHAEIKEAIRIGEPPELFAERIIPQAMVQEMVRDKYASISIDGPTEIGVPEGYDPEVWQSYRIALMRNVQPYQNVAMANEVIWTVIELPTHLQAGLVAPDLSATEALKTLTEMIANVYWLDLPNPSQRWRESSDDIEARSAKLNSLQIKKLRFKSSDTDLTLELHSRARWEGGRLRINGRIVQPNFPTFENFVTPKYRSAEGYVKIQRPVLVESRLVRGAWFKFAKGQVIDFGAEEGIEGLNDFFALDPRNRFLGEVALVDGDSPVNKHERPFYSILFDENALSHIALGAGYPSSFSDPQPVSEADFEAVEMNSAHAIGHTDFMIGSPNMDITGETHDGQIVTIMRQGKIIL